MTKILTTDSVNKYSEVETLNKEQLIEIGITCSSTLWTRILDVFRNALNCFHIRTTWINNYFENRGITLISKYNKHFVPSNFYPEGMAVFAVNAELKKHPTSIISKTNALGEKIEDICAKAEQFKAVGNSRLETALSFFRLCTGEEQQQILDAVGAVFSPKKVKRDDRPSVEILLSAIHEDPVKATQIITLTFLKSYLTVESEKTSEEAIRALSHRITSLFTCVQSKYEEKTIPENILEFLNQVLPLFIQQPKVGERSKHFDALKILIFDFILSDEIIDLLLEKGIQKLGKADKKGTFSHFALTKLKFSLQMIFTLPAVAYLPFVGRSYPRGPFIRKGVSSFLQSCFDKPKNQQAKIAKALNTLTQHAKKEHSKEIVEKACNKLINVAKQARPFLAKNDQTNIDQLIYALSSIKTKNEISPDQIGILEKGTKELHDYIETTKHQPEQQKEIHEKIGKIVDIFIPHSEILKDFFNPIENLEAIQKIADNLQIILDLRKQIKLNSGEVEAIKLKETETAQEARETLKAFLQTLIEKHLSDYFDHLNPALQQILKPW